MGKATAARVAGSVSGQSGKGRVRSRFEHSST